MTALVQLVPGLLPALNGVGDYGLVLARALRGTIGLQSLFLVADPTRESEECIDGFPVRTLVTRSSYDLQRALIEAGSQAESPTILLHMSAYGYARRGCPTWLVDGLECWKTADPGRRLITIFHELYAFGPPWRSEFWLSPLQRAIIARLARLSDSALTNTQRYRHVLERYDPSKKNRILVLPVFSNVGEPRDLPGLSVRKRRIVLFGGAHTRARGYARGRTCLEAACSVLGIEEILDIGPNAPSVPEMVAGVPIRQMGRRSAAEVSDILKESLAGFLEYSPAFLAKSGVFASYAAHGVLPICPSQDGSEDDGIVCGRHYWSGPRRSCPPESSSLQRIADGAIEWYRNHCLDRHLAVVAQVCTAREIPMLGSQCPVD